MKYLVLIRHGTTAWNVHGRLNSFTDLPLSSQGRADVLKLAEYLRQAFPIASLWCSPATRAQETATAIAKARAGGFRTLLNATEVNFGRFEGKVPADLINDPEGEYYAAWENGHPVENVESLADAGTRANQVFKHIIGDDKSTHHILITHGVFIRVFICVNVLNVAPTAYRHLVVDNASVSIVRISEENARLSQLNNRCFL